jgi:hypothetical protein
MHSIHSPNSSNLLLLINQLESLPLHNADRFETMDGLDNPDCTNGKRSEFAATALQVFQETCNLNEEVHVAAADLIGDLLHLVHSCGCEPLTALEHALEHFLAEAGQHLGHQGDDPRIARERGLPVPKKGEAMAVRLDIR